MAIFPNVPVAPGVPPLPRSSTAIIAAVELLVTDLITSLVAQAPLWGIFLDGFPAIVPDSIGGVEYRQNAVLADYSIENGGFESYDKVATPYSARVRLVSGGDEENRAALLNAIAVISADRNLYDVVTPEQVYTSANIERYEYRRTAQNGVGLISVDVVLTEIRTTAESAFTNTQSPSGASSVNGGTVQAQTASGSQSSKLPQVQ